jgi:hypothetical protein
MFDTITVLGWPMHSIDPIDAREAQIARIAESHEKTNALKRHLKEIVEGKAFKGSHRSVKFLEYILDKAIAGQFDALKERVIGVELFGRSPTYETGEDSIVRVAASEVRKRLMQHYLIYGNTSEFHLSLPLGSYVLEITPGTHGDAGLPEAAGVRGGPGATLRESATAPQEFLSVAQNHGVGSHAVSAPAPMRSNSLNWRHWFIFATLLAVAGVAQWATWNHFSHESAPRTSILPWPAFFSSPRNTVLVTSDPNIAEINLLTHRSISVSDYANHDYIPEPNTLTAEELRLCEEFLIGDKSAAVDTPIAVSIAQLAEANSRGLEVRGARSIQLSDLHTDDNFIFLGSPGSDPWVNLFTDQLDFRFLTKNPPGQDGILNAHPHPNEQPLYVAGAPGYATGQSLAIVAFVNNPDQSGQVLILAGVSREGTEAAGKFVVNLPRLATALQNCGIQPSGRLRHFELLLRVNIMAGSPNSSDVVACHILPGGSS